MKLQMKETAIKGCLLTFVLTIFLFVIGILLLSCQSSRQLSFQKETTFSIGIDTNIKKKIIIDSLLKMYDPMDILIITNVTKDKIFVKTFAGTDHSPIMNDTLTIYSIGNYLTCKY